MVKGRLPQILFGLFLNTLSRMVVLIKDSTVVTGNTVSLKSSSGKKGVV